MLIDAKTFPAAALQLILDAEGLDQPGQWPGGDSGITLGHGDDLGYQSAAEFADHWGKVLDHAVYVRLLDAVGFKGERAHELAHRFADLHVTRAQADAVFLGKTLPQYLAATARAFPGLERLPANAQGALVSLVYNRGVGFDHPDEHGRYSPPDSRREMRAIRDEVAKPRPSLSAIAEQIRAMKRLWIGKHEDGLLARRDAEARLVELGA